MVAGLTEEWIEAAIAPVLAKPRGIIVLGSKGSWLVAAPAADGESTLLAPPLTELSAALLAIARAACVLAVEVELEDPVTA
jgi:hypothetical protein